jgi:hypothetical protein
MKMKIELIILLVIGSALVVTAKGDSEPPSGASPTATAQQKLMRPLKSQFDYTPVNHDLWSEMHKLMDSKRPSAAFAEAPALFDSGPESDEWKILIGKALSRSGFPLHAQYLLSFVAAKSVGTRQGFEALRLLVEIAKRQMIDERALEELAFDLDTKIDEAESHSLVGYLRARVLIRKNYPEWAQQALESVTPGTTFAEELKFDQTMQILKTGDSASSYVRFEAIANNPAARAQTVRLARLALARLIFERKDYRASIKTYMTTDVPTRERARALNELAWSYYYDRQYGKALGAIQALKSAYYRQLLSPETLVVEMLIYRELCHYRKVKELVADFLREYKQVYSTIEARKPIEKLAQFWQMALQEGIFQKRANSVQMIRVERTEIDGIQWGDSEIRAQVMKLGLKHERLLDAEITRMMKSRVDALANWFLDMREQVWFLEYESSMRMIQADDSQTDKYDPPKANTTKPDVMFWPVGDESWLDELLDYEVLLKDQCRSVLQKPLRGRGGEE